MLFSDRGKGNEIRRGSVVRNAIEAAESLAVWPVIAETRNQDEVAEMISPDGVREVRRLLAEGRLSQRKIARLVGVSRGTVGAIASGRRPDYEARRRPTPDIVPPSGPCVRCPTCGGRVQMPCLACTVRAMRKPPLLAGSSHAVDRAPCLP